MNLSHCCFLLILQNPSWNNLDLGNFCKTHYGSLLCILLIYGSFFINLLLFTRRLLQGVGQGGWKVFVTGYHITKVIIWSKYSQSNGFKHQNKINFVLIKRLLAGKCMFESFSILWNVVPRLCITLKVSISLGLVGYFSI